MVFYYSIYIICIKIIFFVTLKFVEITTFEDCASFQRYVVQKLIDFRDAFSLAMCVGYQLYCMCYRRNLSILRIETTTFPPQCIPLRLVCCHALHQSSLLRIEHHDFTFLNKYQGSVFDAISIGLCLYGLDQSLSTFHQTMC